MFQIYTSKEVWIEWSEEWRATRRKKERWRFCSGRLGCGHGTGSFSCHAGTAARQPWWGLRLSWERMTANSLSLSVSFFPCFFSCSFELGLNTCLKGCELAAAGLHCCFWIQLSVCKAITYRCFQCDQLSWTKELCWESHDSRGWSRCGLTYFRYDCNRTHHEMSFSARRGGQWKQVKGGTLKGLGIVWMVSWSQLVSRFSNVSFLRPRHPCISCISSGKTGLSNLLSQFRKTSVIPNLCRQR